MLANKILVKGVKVYLQSNVNPVGEVSIEWMTASIHRRIKIAQLNYNVLTGVMKYEYLFSQNEIVNLNAFDYSIAVPDFSLIDEDEIVVESNKSQVMIPASSFETASSLSVVTAISLHPLNHIWSHKFKKLAQEPIVDFTTNSFRQPFYSDVISANETIEDANDCMIQVNKAWGGTASLEYSVDNGATWQANKLFTNLNPGIYLVKVKDSNGDESLVKNIEVLAFV